MGGSLCLQGVYTMHPYYVIFGTLIMIPRAKRDEKRLGWVGKTPRAKRDEKPLGWVGKTPRAKRDEKPLRWGLLTGMPPGIHFYLPYSFAPRLELIM